MNTVFVLILFAHVGSNALTTQEFNSQATCNAAGVAAKNLASESIRQIKWVCVPK